MQTTGRIKDVSLDWRSGKTSITFMVDHASKEEINRLAALESLDITAKKHREKRSLNANAYFHVLVALIAEAVHSDNNAVKNKLIRDYGQYEYIDGCIPTYLVREEYAEKILDKEGIHFCVVGNEHINGIDYTRVAFMRGSHTYDTKEMARLIDGAVEEAKALGIETMPPDELKRMLEAWGR